MPARTSVVLSDFFVKPKEATERFLIKTTPMGTSGKPTRMTASCASRSPTVTEETSPFATMEPLA